MDERPGFQVELVRPGSDVALVIVEGEVDLFTAPQLNQALDSGIDGDAVRLIIDLSKVPFIDSTGLGALVGAVRRVQPLGGRVDVVCDRANVVRTLTVSGLLGVLGLYASREDAVAAAGLSGSEA
jgi:anti-sigma B factor antagonist